MFENVSEKLVEINCNILLNYSQASFERLLFYYQPLP